MNRLKQKYIEQIVPSLQEKLGIKNVMAVPKVTKVTLNMGVADHPQSPRERLEIINNVIDQFKIITGQVPQITRARQSIAGFKLRAGEPLGVMVTLRGQKMWQFLDKLISLALPRVKDFQGVSLTAFDGQGNYSLGLEEQIIFPEVNYDLIDKVRSLQVNINTTTIDNETARLLLQQLGFPFAKESRPKPKKSQKKSLRSYGKK